MVSYMEDVEVQNEKRRPFVDCAFALAAPGGPCGGWTRAKRRRDRRQRPLLRAALDRGTLLLYRPPSLVERLTRQPQSALSGGKACVEDSVRILESGIARLEEKFGLLTNLLIGKFDDVMNAMSHQAPNNELGEAHTPREEPDEVSKKGDDELEEAHRQLEKSDEVKDDGHDELEKAHAMLQEPDVDNMEDDELEDHDELSLAFPVEPRPAASSSPLGGLPEAAGHAAPQVPTTHHDDLQDLAARKYGAYNEEEDVGELVMGDLVKIHGMVSATELNGTLGRLLASFAQSERLAIKLIPGGQTNQAGQCALGVLVQCALQAPQG